MNYNGKLCLLSLALILCVVIAASFGSSVNAQSAGGKVMPVGKAIQIKAPLGLPPVPLPADNPPTADTIALGRRLYYIRSSPLMARSRALRVTLRNFLSRTRTKSPSASARKPALVTLRR